MASGLMLVVGDGTTFTDPGDEVNIDINTTFWIGIYDYVGEMYKASIRTLANIEPAEWTGNTAVYSPPAISTAPGWTHGFYVGEEMWGVDLSDPDSTETPLPGVGCAIEFRALCKGDFWIVLNPSPVLPEDKLIVNIVPEPATVLLFALGALALIGRRR
jgi:hypothetical protein